MARMRQEDDSQAGTQALRSEAKRSHLVRLPGNAKRTVRARQRPQRPWRYTDYKIIVFLLTADGIRQVTYDLSTEDGDIQQRDRQSYRYDAIASVEASVAEDGYREAFKLHLVNGKDITFKAADPLLVEWNPEDDEAAALHSATEDATGLRNTLRILEGVAADGKEWIARESL